MDENAFEKVPVNWNALDALVLDYAENEQLLLGSDKSLSSFVLRSTISHIRGLVEQGSINEALELLQRHAPSLLQDQRLLFRLHKQKFIELLRTGGRQAQDEAIQCLRTVLGPCALTAYPEAYEEFKRLLLVLIYRKDDTGSPVVQEWSESNRIELAATVASVLRAQLRAYDPLFSLALRYLLSTHNCYCSRQGAVSPIAELCNALVEKGRDPPATPHDCLLEAPKFDESDVQALAHAVDLSRQGAVDSLRYSGGDLHLALKNELSRIRLDTGLLDDLVHDYCVYRGLIDPTTSASITSSEIINGVPERIEEHGSFVKDNGEDASKAFTVSDTSEEHRNLEKSVHHTCDGEHKRLMRDLEDAAMEDQGDSRSEHSMVDESVRTDSCAGSESICSTSSFKGVEQKQSSSWRKFQPSCPRKRWAGRSPLSQNGNQKFKKERHFSSLPNGHITANKAVLHLTNDEGYDMDKFRQALEIREMACEGLILEVIQKVNRLNSQFFEYNPHFLFQLKQVEFLKLVDAGNYADALSIARCVMGPLAAKHTDLLKPLKETVLALARPQGEQFVKSVSPFILGTTLQVALSASLGISEPALMRIMKATLHMHTEWFKLQMCADPFAEMLSINTMKDTESASLGLLGHTNMPETSTVNSKAGPSNVSSLSYDGGQPQQAESSRERAMFDDGAILTVMEWMAISRGDAIQLLAQYDGSVETVLEHFLP